MALLPKRREPRHPLASLRTDIDRLFDDFIGRDMLPAEWRNWGEFPTLDIHETDKSVEVTAEVPGMKAEEIDLSIYGDTLTIRGEKKEEREDRKRSTYRIERRYGSFERRVQLPCQVKPDMASATYKDGLLKVEMPKEEEAIRKTRKIPVK